MAVEAVAGVGVVGVVLWRTVVGVADGDFVTLSGFDPLTSAVEI